MSSGDSAGGRSWLLAWRNVEQLMAQGPFLHPIPAGESTVLSYDGTRLSVIVALAAGENPEGLPALPQALNFTADPQQRKLTVTCEDRDLQKYFYTYIGQALELIRAQGAQSVAAFKEAWTRLGELLEEQVVLSREKQLGLIGELRLLEMVAANQYCGWSVALDAWHGSANTEHDFALPTVDLEVKTTSKESRVHMIGSLNQLRESPGRPLYLVSFQYSSSPLHANGSTSLNDKVQGIRAALARNADLSRRFDDRMKLAGWDPAHNPHYSARFIERAEPRLILVNSAFPRIIPENLTGLPADLRSRIQSVVYSIDVSGLGAELTTQGLEELTK